MTKYRLTIGLLSLSILSTEFFWTRLFSAEFYYTFAFLILSLAVLGLGLGALFSKMVMQQARSGRLPALLSLSALMLLLAVPLVFALNLDFSRLISDPLQPLKLAGAILLLGSAHFFAGIALAQIFKLHPHEIPQLYMADLLGASIGVVLFILVMNSVGAGGTYIFCALPMLLAAYVTGSRWQKAIPVVLMAGAVGYLIVNGGLPEQKREERAPVVYTHWDATAKIKIYAYDSTARGINIDNIANSPVYQFDGNWNVPDSQKIHFAIDVRNLISRFDRCRFLSLGAGGGTDVLQALQYGAAEVHAVEVIPHINAMMKDGYLREFSGNIYNDPRVRVVTEDARSYIRRHHNSFDIIYSLSSNSWAAFASGSFALAENYIFSTEAFIDYWNALSPEGFLSIEHQFYAPRLVAEVVDALTSLQVKDPLRHIAVYDLQNLRRKVLLVSRKPLDGEMISLAYANSDSNVVKATRRLYPPMETNRENIINAIAEAGWQRVADTARIDVSPCTDDRPFIAQLGLLRNLDPIKLEKLPLYEFTGFPLAKVIMLVILAVCVVLIVPLNLLPYAAKGAKLRAAPWLYFFTVGLGYMMIEVILIQQYTLYIGSSVYSMGLVLTVLLVSSGLGSRYSRRFRSTVVFLGIATWLVADIFLFRHLFYALGNLELAPRMALSTILIAPVGFFMGMPFPKAASRLSELVDWAFAVNGSASVLGSVLVVLVASSYGYSVGLGLALLMYLCAFGLYKRGFGMQEPTNQVQEGTAITTGIR
jgi:predicted membrane-bound spermidine synthase